jgi:hypothetical protein
MHLPVSRLTTDDRTDCGAELLNLFGSSLFQLFVAQPVQQRQCGRSLFLN